MDWCNLYGQCDVYGKTYSIQYFPILVLGDIILYVLGASLLKQLNQRNKKKIDMKEPTDKTFEKYNHTTNQ